MSLRSEQGNPSISQTDLAEAVNNSFDLFWSATEELQGSNISGVVRATTICPSCLPSPIGAIGWTPDRGGAILCELLAEKSLPRWLRISARRMSQVIMENTPQPKKLWFRVRQYGWGWAPWLITIAIAAALIGGDLVLVLLLGDSTPAFLPHVSGWLIAALLGWNALVLVPAIWIWTTGERPPRRGGK